MASNNIRRSESVNNIILTNKFKNGNISDNELAYLFDNGDMGSLMNDISSNPEMQKRISMFIQSPESQYYTSKIRNWGNIAKQLAGIGLGIGQISSSNKSLDNIKEPRTTPQFKESPELKAALDEARMAYESPELAGVLSPAKQAMAEAYRNQVSNMQTLSGGQSGATAAGAQAAYTGRLKGAQQLPAISQQAKAQNAQMYSNLLGQQQLQARNKSWYDIAKAKQDWNRYLTESIYAGQLGQTGIKNLFNSGYGLINQAAPAIGSLFAKNYTGFGPTVDGYNNYINNEFNRREKFPIAPDLNDLNIPIEYRNRNDSIA